MCGQWIGRGRHLRVLGIVEQREVDVCRRVRHVLTEEDLAQRLAAQGRRRATGVRMQGQERDLRLYALAMTVERKLGFLPAIAGRHRHPVDHAERSEEHTSELQSLMRISYAVFCLKKKNTTTQ